MKQNSRNHFEEKLAEDHACYVIITCDQPSQDGHMKVQMSHGGDTTLASYLLQGAQSAMDEQLDHDNSTYETDLRLVK